MDHWNELIEEVRQQHACLDMLAFAWRADYQGSGGQVFCGKGCRNCCSLAVNATLTEAVAIAGQISEEQAQALQAYVERLLRLIRATGEITTYLKLYRQELGQCPFLAPDGSCGVYEIRPLSCRALLSTREESWCGLDFSTLSSAEKQAYVEGLDRSVVAFPTHYAVATREAAEQMEACANRRMKDRFRFSLYGSMPAMVDLVRRHGLAEACRQGGDAVASLLAERGADHPFLLHLER